eukprot:3002699-Pyramimonas_sp.AAC.1
MLETPPFIDLQPNLNPNFGPGTAAAATVLAPAHMQPVVHESAVSVHDRARGAVLQGSQQRHELGSVDIGTGHHKRAAKH